MVPFGCFVILSLFLGLSSTDAVNKTADLRTVNVQSQFLRWPNPSGIPYYLDPAYTSEEQALILAAMQKITADMKTCIGFTLVTAASPGFKVKITPFQDDGITPEQFCFSYPGFYRDLQNAGKTEQRLVLTRGATGCFDGNLRSLMKYFAVLLGKRNEHQRADRNEYISVNQDALQTTFSSTTAYRLYGVAEAYWSAFPYDYCSITHNRVTDFAKQGSVAFTVKQAPFFIPAFPRLSNSDCQLISLMYPGCDRKKCDPLDCASVTTTPGPFTSSLPPSTTPAGPPPPVTFPNPNTPTSPPLICTTASAASTLTSSATSASTTSSTMSSSTSTQQSSTTTVMSTTTLAPRTPCVNGDFKQFCNSAPTASLLYQTGTDTTQDVYVLISGNCAMKYMMGTNSGGAQAIDPSLVKDGKPNPVDIREIYPGYEAFGQTLPINFAYLSSAGGPVYLSNSAKPITAAACSFPNSDPTKPCDGSTWPTAPLAGVLSSSAPSLSTVTVVPHDQFYVYFAATNQLCLSQTGRPTAALPSSQCLTLTTELLDPKTNNKIEKVTAIQYINHDKDPAVMIFGTNAAGVPLIAFGDAVKTRFSRPPTAPTSFETYGGSFSMATYTNNMQC